MKKAPEIPGTHGQNEPKHTEQTDIRQNLEVQDSRIDTTTKGGLAEIQYRSNINRLP